MDYFVSNIFFVSFVDTIITNWFSSSNIYSDIFAPSPFHKGGLIKIVLCFGCNEELSPMNPIFKIT